MDFDIDVYLGSLPEDTDVIDVSDKRLTYLPPTISRFTNLKRLNCNHNRLTSLPNLPETLNALYCCDNELTFLPPLNETLVELFCNNNNLSSLPSLNENLRLLYCSNNRLTTLPILPENLRVLYCDDNRLIALPNLNDTLKWLWFSSNPISNIIENDYYDCLDITKKQIYVLNRFRWLYYSLKFKKRFRDWLWIRVREPQIREKYHPRYLENLDEEADLDEVLENWAR
jgi:hypothetical protein